jgi:SAM-dependent methyltransferase
MKNYMIEETLLFCKICGSSDGIKKHIVPEMMLGTRDEFDYIECEQCGCLQIVNTPLDIYKYYPSTYCSYKFVLNVQNKFKLYVKSLLIKERWSSKRFFGKQSSFYQGYEFLDLLHSGGYLKHNTRILDVGCGVGELLLQLKYLGFKYLKGIDPFINQDIKYENGVSIDKKYLHEANEIYDLIMLNHSFEHMEDPKSALMNINKMLSSNGCALIRIPIASSFAWKHYGVNWVQLDAPRHLYLHTIESMDIMSAESGLHIVDIHFDSNEFQFWGSEQYKRGMPLPKGDPFCWEKSGIFTKKQINEYKIKASQLNDQGHGDMACFLLKKQP